MYNILLDKNIHFKDNQNNALSNTIENRILNKYDIYNAPQVNEIPPPKISSSYNPSNVYNTENYFTNKNEEIRKNNTLENTFENVQNGNNGDDEIFQDALDTIDTEQSSTKINSIKDIEDNRDRLGDKWESVNQYYDSNKNKEKINQFENNIDETSKNVEFLRKELDEIKKKSAQEKNMEIRGVKRKEIELENINENAKKQKTMLEIELENKNEIPKTIKKIL